MARPGSYRVQKQHETQILREVRGEEVQKSPVDELYSMEQANNQSYRSKHDQAESICRGPIFHKGIMENYIAIYY